MALFIPRCIFKSSSWFHKIRIEFLFSLIRETSIMHFFVVLCLTWMNRIRASPVVKSLEGNPLNQKSFPLSVANEAPCNENTLMNIIPDEEFDESSNIVRRFHSSCPATISGSDQKMTRPNDIYSTMDDSDDDCDDPNFNVPVTCGGPRVQRTPPSSTHETTYLVLACLPGKLFSKNPPESNTNESLSFRLPRRITSTLALAAPSKTYQILLLRLSRSCESNPIPRFHKYWDFGEIAPWFFRELVCMEIGCLFQSLERDRLFSVLADSSVFEVARHLRYCRVVALLIAEVIVGLKKVETYVLNILARRREKVNKHFGLPILFLFNICCVINTCCAFQIYFAFCFFSLACIALITLWTLRGC